MFLAKKRSSLEVINDLNGDLVNFYRCVRYHAETLLTEIEFDLYCAKKPSVLVDSVVIGFRKAQG